MPNVKGGKRMAERESLLRAPQKGALEMTGGWKAARAAEAAQKGISRARGALEMTAS
jgi:hypothetical protein